MSGDWASSYIPMYLIYFYSYVFQYQPISTIDYLIKPFITNPQLRVAVKTPPFGSMLPDIMGRRNDTIGVGQSEWD